MPHDREAYPSAGEDEPTRESGDVAVQAWEVLRDRYWERAGVEGLSLDAFCRETMAGHTGRARLRTAELLRALVDDVTDTRLANIALKAGEEGAMYAALAEEREAEVRAEHERLMALLEELASDAP